VRGKALSLQARRFGQKAGATLHPSETTDLHLVLAGPTKQTGGSLSYGAPDELKVPEIFRAR
jgi:hypothetical protein